MNIISIDLGKFNSMMCCYDSSTRTYRLEAIATERSYFRSVFTNLQPDLVVIEACGPSGWVSDLCQELEIKILVCSTNEKAWMFKNVKRKTDKDDALKLARLAAIDQLVPTHVPRKEMRERRRLDQIAKDDPQIQRVQTINGVGRVTAEAIVNFIDDPHRFKNARQAGAYAGLIPKQYQSGNTDRRGRITQRGPRLLRTLLWLVRY